jgi:hypothetical protein
MDFHRYTDTDTDTYVLYFKKRLRTKTIFHEATNPPIIEQPLTLSPRHFIRIFKITRAGVGPKDPV